MQDASRIIDYHHLNVSNKPKFLKITHFTSTPIPFVKGEFFGIFSNTLQLTLLYRAPLRFHCVGKWLRFWHWQSGALTAQLNLILIRLNPIHYERMNPDPHQL
jgi:hypothetical protein